MPECSTYHARRQVLLPNCCKYKANGTRKEITNEMPKPDPKKHKSYSSTVLKSPSPWNGHGWNRRVVLPDCCWSAQKASLEAWIRCHCVSLWDAFTSCCASIYIHLAFSYYIYIYIHTLHYISLHYININITLTLTLTSTLTLTLTLTLITLHYITLHYTTLHYTTLHYTTLHYTTLHYITLHYITYIHTYIHT